LSTCHWCHVMERECFEDDEVAEVLNRVFVSIKVDREERPDIDNTYMSVCQSMTGSGGWPLSIIMSPDKRPFFAGTYFPRESRQGRMGLIELSQRVEKLWQTAREDIDRTADSVVEGLQSMFSVTAGKAPGEEVLHSAYQELEKRYDEKLGGFGSAPKFPTPHNLTFLLRYWKRTKNEKALQMVEKTLTAMSNGGIYDHLGFGFHRYSTDRKWLLPHFEKMLYDQALLAFAHLETFQAAGKQEFAVTAREIFAYVLRDMTSPEGGFYSAEDADSEGEEGKFYVWTAGEIRELLGEEDAALFSAVYCISEEGNFHDEATGILTGKNILHLTKPLTELAKALELDVSSLKDKLDTLRQKLFSVRKKRIHPYKDDKILTDWNGLMIAALAVGGRVLGDSNYTKSAVRAAGFILSHLKKGNRLLKRYREGEASLPAHLDDYSFMIWGLLELYETTFDASYLSDALALNQTLIDHFWDNKNGSFYFTADDGEDILVRHRELYDGAVPSGNSVSALNNLRLARLTGNAELEQIAQKTAGAYEVDLQRVPSAYTFMLSALDFALGPTAEVVIAGDLQDAKTRQLLEKLFSSFIPRKVVLLHQPGDEGRQIEAIAPFTREQNTIDGKAAAYVCRDFSCQAPVTDATEMMSLIEREK
jgi:uncharacterized protein